MKRFGLRLTIAILAAGTAAWAHADVENPDVKARMDSMSAIGSSMKILGQTAKGATEFDATAIEAALERISLEAERVPSLFTPEADDPKSEAKAEIWTDFDTFTDLAADLKAAADKNMGQIQAVSDVQAAMGDLGAACKACHSKFKE